MLSPLDYVLLHLGSPGRYHIFFAFLLCCLQFPISFTGLIWKFYTEEPPHRCLLRPNDSFHSNVTLSESEWYPIVKQENKVKTYESCSMYLDAYNHWKGTQKCIYGWQYRPPENEHNVVIEYDLVCERKYLMTALFYISHMTAIAGAIIFAIIGDRCERKPSLMLSLYLFISSAFSLHFVTDFLQFSILYSLQTFFAAGLQITSYVLLIELFATPYQLRASLYSICFNISATLLLPLLVWSVRNWRFIQLAISAPCVVFLAYIWLLPQSPLWLVVNGRLHSAENLIERLSHQNGKIISPSFRLHLQNLYNVFKHCPDSQSLRHRVLPKFSSPGLRWYTLVHFYLFFVVAISTDVTESQTIRLNGNQYAHYFYRSLMDLGSAMIVYYFAIRLGPRFVQSFVMIVSGLLLMTSITLQEMLPKLETNAMIDFDYRLLLLPSTFVLIARTLTIALPALIWFHVMKTMPTGIRATGLAICFCWTQIGQMAAPHLIVLSELIAPFIPMGLCGSLLVCGGGLSLLFPNCYRKPLPNTVEEAENKTLPTTLKQRYPSYRDLKNGKISSVAVNGSGCVNGCAVGLNQNVYTIAPNNTYDKTAAKQSQHSDINQNQHLYEHRLTEPALERHESSASLTQIPFTQFRPTTLYNDDTDSRLSDIEDLNESNNWKLFSNFSQNQNPINRMGSFDNHLVADDHLVSPLSRPSQLANRYLSGANGSSRRFQTRDSVAETNL